MIQRRKILFRGMIVFLLFISGVVAVSLSDQPEQWTVRTLKEYFEQRLDAMDLAITKAETATEKRFEGVNEFRFTLSDQQRTFVPRQEYEAGHLELSNRVNDLKAKVDKIENMKSGGNVVWAYVIAGVSLIIAIFTLKDKIKTQ